MEREEGRLAALCAEAFYGFGGGGAAEQATQTGGRESGGRLPWGYHHVNTSAVGRERITHGFDSKIPKIQIQGLSVGKLNGSAHGDGDPASVRRAPEQKPCRLPVCRHGGIVGGR